VLKTYQNIRIVSATEALAPIPSSPALETATPAQRRAAGSAAHFF
jgi:hypothetical protein